MLLQTLTLIAALSGHAIATTPDSTVYKHVAAFSINSLHGSDVEKYVALRPGSTIAALLNTGFEYTHVSYCITCFSLWEVLGIRNCQLQDCSKIDSSASELLLYACYRENSEVTLTPCASSRTSAPSDSFPGTMNFVTGASPRTTGG